MLLYSAWNIQAKLGHFVRFKFVNLPMTIPTYTSIGLGQSIPTCAFVICYEMSIVLSGYSHDYPWQVSYAYRAKYT